MAERKVQIRPVLLLVKAIHKFRKEKKKENYFFFFAEEMWERRKMSRRIRREKQSLIYRRREKEWGYSPESRLIIIQKRFMNWSFVEKLIYSMKCGKVRWLFIMHGGSMVSRVSYFINLVFHYTYIVLQIFHDLGNSIRWQKKEAGNSIH